MLLTVLLVAPAAEAQVAAVQVGAKVRIEAIGGDAGPVVGTVVLRSGDVVSIRRTNRELLTLPASRITSLEVSVGKTRAYGARTGAIAGGGWGAALGLLSIGAAHTCTGADLTRECGTAEPPEIAKWVGMWTVSGALFGAGLGAIVRREQWERVIGGGRTSMTWHARGAGLTVAFR